MKLNNRILTSNSDPEKLWGDELKIVTSLELTLAHTIEATEPAEITIIGKNVAGLNVVLDPEKLTCDGATLNITTSDENGAVGTVTFAQEGTATLKIGYGDVTKTQEVEVGPEPVRSISFNADTYTLSGTEGDTITETFTVTTDKGDNVTGDCTYSLQPNDTGLTSSNGTLDASSVTAGNYSVTITATYNGLTATATVSLTIASAHDYSRDYLTFEALESGTFTFSNALNYSLDDGETWVALAANTATPTVSTGDSILFKAEITPTSSAGVGMFTSTGEFNASGNPLSLLYGANFASVRDISAKSYAFYMMFWGGKVVSAENLSLAATTLGEYCYYGMFYGCTSLTTAPALPATALANYCYYQMFMGCTSLVSAPALPATTLAAGCYNSMFNGCTALTTAPALPATTLANKCYYYMFNGCTNLNNVTMLATTNATTANLYNWLSGVSATGTFTKAAAQTSLESGASGIPTGWTVVDAS